MRRAHTVRLLSVVAGLALLVPSPAFAQKATKAVARPAPVLRVDPVLIGEAGEVWKLVAGPNNPIWAGWDASSTPVLLYLPGEQDVLINHPHPPDGFAPYPGALGFPGARVAVKSGPTLIEWDGQNTSKDVGGVRTLVVADTLSNLRSRMSGLLQETRPAAEKAQALKFSDLATDPYEQLGLIVHEAFHVFQDTHAPDKGANEMLLLQYPVLSVQNNVGMAQEGAALAEALRAKDDAAFRRAAVRWLALRKDRRANLPPKAVEYEDGVEFSEGLATYAQYRLFQALEGRRPGAAMAWAQGFAGYGDLSPQRERLIDEMVKNMAGDAVVNNDPYGTAPLRRRLYFSGMGIGVMLDRVAPDWKRRILAPNVSLTSLAEEALKPTAAESALALTAAHEDAGYSALVESKTRLAQEGSARAEAQVKEIEDGPGVGLIVDYSQLESPKLRMAFTPFGITRIDGDRTIFSQLPIKILFAPETELAQKVPAPLLRDTGKRLVRFRLPAAATRSDLTKALGEVPADGTTAGPLALDAPGATIKVPRARVSWSGENLVIVLLKTEEKK